MFRTSFPLGKVFGVDLRVHLTFPILLLLSVVYATVVTGDALRGVGLWMALVFAVVVRELARALAVAYSGLRLRAMFLLPIGGVMAFAPPPAGESEPPTRMITAAGPAANVLCGLLLLAACYGFVPGIHLVEQPWLSVQHILRSVIWMQFALALLGLLPSTLSARPVVGSKGRPDAAKPAGFHGIHLNVGSMLALGAVLLGLALMNIWLICLGAFFFFTSQLGSPTRQALASREAESVCVRDVMLTEFVLLSASDTLSGALAQSVHSLQDVFPVVRGDQLVGAIARVTLAERLQSEGDTFLQGLMTKKLPVAEASEKLVSALRRSSEQGASECIPVVEDGALVGILTPESLSPERLGRAMQVLRPNLRGKVARDDE